MKAWKTISSIMLSAVVLAGTVNALSVKATDAISVNAPSENAFFWQGKSYVISGGCNCPSGNSSEYISSISVDYECRADITDNHFSDFNLATVSTASPHHSNYYGSFYIPIYWNIIDNKYNIDDVPYPLFTGSDGNRTQYGPYLRYTATTNYGNQYIKWIKGNILAFPSLDEYKAIDPNVYYQYYGNSSFCDAATGQESESAPYSVIHYYSYNCMAYAFDQVNGGWLWPYYDEENEVIIPATPANTISIVYDITNHHFTQNTNPYHAGAKAIAYGENNTVAHFAKVTAWNASTGEPVKIISKWGGAELIASNSANPFTASSGYGSPLVFFNGL